MKLNKEYFAFISYKSEDSEWAIWLQHELENYHLPISFNGRNDIRQDLRPVFRDSDELSAGNLPKQIQEALGNSLNLIVVCSPKAAKSPWVNLEIETFISLGKTDHIFPFIVEGDAPSEFFPPALLGLPRSEERLGGNVLKNGKDAAFVKIVAGMLGLGFDSLWNRYEREKAEKERIQREQRDHLLRLQSRFVSEKAMNLIDMGDAYTARVLLLNVMPTPIQPQFPYTPEAELALRKSMAYDSAILRGHTNQVNYAAVSPDGNYIASISDDNTIKIWKSVNGELIHTINGYFHFTNSICFSPNSKWIAFVDKPWDNGFYQSHNIVIWDIDSGLLVKQINYPDTVNYVNFHPSDNSTIVIATNNGGFCIYDLKLDKTILQIEGKSISYKKHKEEVGGKMINVYKPETIKGHYLPVNYTEFSPTENRVITASKDRTVCVWNSKTGNHLITLEGHKSDVYSAQYSPDGKNIITASHDGTARTWSSKKGKLIYVLEDHESDRSITFSASYNHRGNLIATASSDNSIIVWDANKGKMLQKYAGHTESVKSALFSPDDKIIVSASEDFTVRIWNFTGKREKITLMGHKRSVNNISYSKDGKYLVSCSSAGEIFLWDTSCWKKMSVAFKKLSKGHYLNEKGTLRNHELLHSTVAFSPNGKTIVSASYDNFIRIWDTSNGLLLRSIYLQQNWSDLSFSANFSHDGKFIVVSTHGFLIILDASTGNHVSIYDFDKNGHTGSVMYSVFSHNDLYVASAGGDQKVKIWDVSKKELLHTFSGHSDTVECVQFSHDDRYLVSASKDHTIKIWSMMEKKLLRTIYAHEKQITSISLSPDDRFIVSASDDNTIKVWDFHSGCLLETLNGRQERVNCVSFSPNGREIVSASYDSTIKIWEFLPIEEIVMKAMEKCGERQLTQKERRLFYLE